MDLPRFHECWLQNPRRGQNNVSIRTNISHNPMERNLGTEPVKGCDRQWLDDGDEMFSFSFFTGLLLRIS